MRAPVVGITAARRADEQAALVRSLGGMPLMGPTVGVDRPAPDAAIVADLLAALSPPPDVAVFLTGVGARHLLGAADRGGLGADLRRALSCARVLVRGAKPRAALRDAGVRHDWITPGSRTSEVRDHLLAGGVRGLRVLLQCAGEEPEPMAAALAAAGARVRTVHPYAIAPARDVARAMALARAAGGGLLDAVTFTNARAVSGFVAVAERAGVDLGRIAAGRTLVASVGPATSAALRAAGLPPAVEPSTPRMGAMYGDLARLLRGEVAA